MAETAAPNLNPYTKGVRPTIALALGAGVARGWAHIGVIRALERAGYVPDIVVGTSIGALVGGAYVAGKLDMLEEWARSLTRRGLLQYLDLSWGGSAVFSGKVLEKLLVQHLGETRIEDLDRRFVCVTTELATGHELWVRRGSLIDGMRASYALPGVFSPVRIDGRWMIDGALVNPVPVSVCRAFGGRVVIAVNLSVDSFGAGAVQTGERLEGAQFDAQTQVEGPIKSFFAKRTDSGEAGWIKKLFGTAPGTPGMGTVMLASFNIAMDRLSRSRLAGDPPDVTVVPRTGHIGITEFHRAAEMIEIGEKAVERSLPYIERAMDVLR